MSFFTPGIIRNKELHVCEETFYSSFSEAEDGFFKLNNIIEYAEGDKTVIAHVNIESDSTLSIINVYERIIN